MKTRVISAVVLIILLAIVLALPAVAAAIVLAAMAAIAAYELLYRTELVRHPRLVLYTMLMAAWIPVWCYLGMSHAWGTLVLLVFTAALFAEMMANHIKLRFEAVAMCYVAGMLIPYLLSGLLRILLLDHGKWLVIIPMILAFIPDSGAYFAGCYFGRHKLAPVISPKKTVEGAVGGCIAAVLGMLLYAVIVDLSTDFQVHYGLALLYAVVGAGADIFGDLMFSAIKRQTGIKDYGNLIPGHGGILDRFDSMMIVAPLTEVLLALLPLVV